MHNHQIGLRPKELAEPIASACERRATTCRTLVLGQFLALCSPSLTSSQSAPFFRFGINIESFNSYVIREERNVKQEPSDFCVVGRAMLHERHYVRPYCYMDSVIQFADSYWGRSSANLKCGHELPEFPLRNFRHYLGWYSKSRHVRRNAADGNRIGAENRVLSERDLGQQS